MFYWSKIGQVILIYNSISRSTLLRNDFFVSKKCYAKITFNARHRGVVRVATTHLFKHIVTVTTNMRLSLIQNSRLADGV